MLPPVGAAAAIFLGFPRFSSARVVGWLFSAGGY